MCVQTYMRGKIMVAFVVDIYIYIYEFTYVYIYIHT